MGAGGMIAIQKGTELIGNLASTIASWNAAKKAEEAQKKLSKKQAAFGQEIGARYDRPDNEISGFREDILAEAKGMPVETVSRQSQLVREELMQSMGMASGEIEESMGGGVGGAEALANMYIKAQGKSRDLAISDTERMDRQKREKTSTMIGAFSQLAGAEERQFDINEDRFRQAQDTADILKMSSMETRNVADMMSAQKYAVLGQNLDNMITQLGDTSSMMSAGVGMGGGAK